MTDLYWEDSTNSSGLQGGQYGYAGYFNGPFANLSSIHNRFPGKPVMGYATRVAGSHGADAIDCEPGTLGSSFSENAAGAVTFVRAWTGGSGLFSKPIVYCMASWVAPMEDYLANHGIQRSAYWMNSSHATGSPHYCGPNSCGWGHDQADLTQYAFAGPYDRTIMHSYVLRGGSPVPPPVTPGLPTLKVGATGKAVVTLRIHLDAWGAHLPALADGGVDKFGPLVLAAVKNFQKSQKLAADGVVGPATWTAVLKRPPAPVTPTPKPPVPVPAPPPVVKMPTSVLKLGSKGADVKTLQQRLHDSGIIGVRGITVDGTFSVQTDRAVRNFQKAKNLTPDGIVGPLTWAEVWKVK